MAHTKGHKGVPWSFVEGHIPTSSLRVRSQNVGASTKSAIPCYGHHKILSYTTQGAHNDDSFPFTHLVSH
ncbi:hypothetical protein TorRG33x02_079600 [Trema orientale]|uniref:Uncharacterized protein n=1 Tax=Trema orientale TaxID=63057 RepID=A0A2P5FEY9_TREOI|nr:hypothetical protein TorRG33x02_079600 [Trema orientale]